MTDSQKKIQEILEEKFGIWMCRYQIERYLKMRNGTFPVEKLNIFDIDPGGRRPRYTTASVAALIYASRKPASMVLRRG